DSITTSSTCCSISHSASRCNCSGLLPYQRRSNKYSLSTSTSATTTANFFLWTSIPAILYAIGFLLAGAEGVLGIQLSRASGYRRSHRGRDNAPFIRSLTHAPDQTGRRPWVLHCDLNLATPSHCGLLLGCEPFSWGFAGWGPKGQVGNAGMCS